MVGWVAVSLVISCSVSNVSGISMKISQGWWGLLHVAPLAAGGVLVLAEVVRWCWWWWPLVLLASNVGYTCTYIHIWI